MAIEEYLRTSVAARRAGVAAETMRRWTREGRVAAITLPSGERRVPSSELDRLLTVSRRH